MMTFIVPIILGSLTVLIIVASVLVELVRMHHA